MFQECKNSRRNISYKGSVSEMKGSNRRHVCLLREGISLEMFDRFRTMTWIHGVQQAAHGGLFLFVAI